MPKNLKLITWNVNGIRSIFKKGFEEFLTKESPDILCLQESKIAEDQLKKLFEDNLSVTEKYEVRNFAAARRGYSGVTTFVKKSLFDKGFSWRFSELSLPSDEEKVEEKVVDLFLREGRVLVLEFKTPSGEVYEIYNTYFPSGTSGDVRQSLKYCFLEVFYEILENGVTRGELLQNKGMQNNSLLVQKSKTEAKASAETTLDFLPKTPPPIRIICGDFNICHQEIDIHHPQTAKKLQLSGFQDKEREWMDKLINLGFKDSYRELNPESQQFSWWTYRSGAREKNLGWRIDYVFIEEHGLGKLKNSSILGEVSGSDHCPVVVEFAT